MARIDTNAPTATVKQIYPYKRRNYAFCQRYATQLVLLRHWILTLAYLKDGREIKQNGNRAMGGKDLERSSEQIPSRQTKLVVNRYRVHRNQQESNIWVYNGALSTWQLPYNQSPGGAVYSGYLTGTTFKLLNNVTGNVDYTADNAVNCIPAINSAFANMQNIPNLDTLYGGDIELMAGKYRCTTTLDMTIEATNRNALGLKSNTWGTVLILRPEAEH